jgi:hypothetical protein
MMSAVGQTRDECHLHQSERGCSKDEVVKHVEHVAPPGVTHPSPMDELHREALAVGRWQISGLIQQRRHAV